MIKKMSDEKLMSMMQVRFRRIGLNSFRAFIVESNGKERMYEEVLGSESCMEIGNITVDDLRKLPIEKPEDVEPLTFVSMRGTLKLVLMTKCDSNSTVALAKTMLAERLVIRGFNEKELIACMGGTQGFGKTVVDKVVCYLNAIQNDDEKIKRFIDLAYSREWLDNISVQHWFETVAKTKGHNLI